MGSCTRAYKPVRDNSLRAVLDAHDEADEREVVNPVVRVLDNLVRPQNIQGNQAEQDQEDGHGLLLSLAVMTSLLNYTPWL